ncbi:mpv17-like protein 2 isoform X2 [Ostrea edulis]|uniref:mpv17-like protein 2 isoform X2 n=1 Tax=Ostrea edulis TaxID=37623 RepID=UPI0020965CF6|nr:mpv17-like protein 2 isoform X2 [Ostrea edulis]
MGLRFSKLKRAIITEHLLLTNVLTTGGLMGLGDVITQNLEIRMDKEGKQKYSLQRTERMLAVGLALGPFGHLWYSKIVDKLVPGVVSTRTAVKKILADQVVAGPFFCSAFFFGMGLLEGKGNQGAIAEVKEKFLPVYMLDWCVWPPLQFINFRFLPMEYRVIYVACITLCWNTFLSYYKHMDSHQHQEIPEQTKS